jgi:Flp pilus assembly protein TadD
LRILWLGHKHAAIVELCRQGLAQAQGTNRVLFHTDLARALVLVGKPEEAMEEANHGVDFAGDKERLYAARTRALVFAETGRYDQAVAECQQLFKDFTEPGDVREIRYTLSSVYSLAKNPAKSEEQLQRILEADANDATANNDLGYLWADQNKNLDEAEKLIRKALKLDREQRTSGKAVSVDSDQDNAAYVDSLGWVLFRKGQLTAARRELEKAVALPDGGDDPVVWDHLGDICFRQDDRAAAGKAWRKAIELYEGGRRMRDDRYKEVQDKRKRLQPVLGPH